MGKITKERPHGFKTETEAWGENTGRIEVVEKLIDNKLNNEDNYYILFTILDTIEGVTSLGTDKQYVERIKKCRELKKRLGGKDD